MFRKINIFLVLLLLIFVSVSAVGAVDDENITVSSSDETILDTSDVEEIVSSVETDSDSSDDVLSSGSVTVNVKNYLSYFDKDGNVLSTVKSGDTVKLDGSFSKCNFIFNKKVNIEGTSSNSLNECTVKLLSGASGSTVSNLKIKNTNNYAYGVCLDGASNCIVKKCFINNTGQASYSVAIGNSANNNQIIDNTLSAYGVTYGHGSRSTPPLVVFCSDYNYIANNRLYCDDSNGIYLSSYGAGSFKDGESNHNKIYNNIITYNVVPTSWSYGIQVMGAYNTIDSNTIYGAYRGVSTSTLYEVGENVIINNKIIDLRGLNYQDGKPSGGENAIVGTYKSTVKNNIIENSVIMASGSAISVLDESVVENNKIIITGSGKGIKAHGSNVIVRNNNITTEEGAGVFQESAAYNLLVENNIIKSETGIGVLLKKESLKERPADVKIIGNIISTNAQYIIDAGDVEKDSNWIISNNKGGEVLTPKGSYNANRPVYEFNGTIHYITPQSFGRYIDSNGYLKSDIVNDYDILYFQGVFTNKEVITINSPVKITSNNAVFYNTTFKITCGGTWIENLTILNSGYKINNWGIVVNNVDDGVMILNNNISVLDLRSAYAIYIIQSNFIDVINNTLYSSGDFLTYTLLAYSVIDSKFINNTISTLGTGEMYGPDSEYCLDGNDVCLDGSWTCLDGNEVCLDGSSIGGSHIVQEIHRTYGMLMLYSSGNDISRNKVTVSSKINRLYNSTGANASKNTVIGIDLYYNCHSNILSDNEVYVKSMDNYIYGMGVLGYYTGMNAPFGQGATKNQFINNKIDLDGTYFATGIIVGDESENTVVKNNIIRAKANNVSYGITLEMSQKSKVENNDVELNSDISYGIEVEKSNGNIIEGNILNLNSKKIYGIAMGSSKNNDIINNKIAVNSLGDFEGMEFDVINGPTSGILLQGSSSNNVIESNNITSNKGYAINLDSLAKDNIIADNYLVSQLGKANDAVNSTENNKITGNYIYLINDGTLLEATVQYLEYGNYTFKVGQDIEGAKVDFYLADLYIGTSYIKYNKTVLNYCLANEDYTPADYELSCVVTKEDYKITKFYSTVTFTKGNLDISVLNISVKDGLKGKFTATVVNSIGNPISNVNVIFYRGLQPIGSSQTDINGIATLVTTVPRTLSGVHDIRAKISDMDYYLGSEGIGKLTILDVAPVNIQVDTTLSFGGILATLTDNNGFVLDGKKVSLKIGGVSYNIKTNSKGQIILPDVKTGIYNFEITLNSDSDYEQVNYVGKLSVLSPLNENKNFNVYYGTTVQYKVRVIGADGSYVGANQNVVIKVAGKTYNVKTDAKGYAVKSLKLGVGKYTITAEYNGYKVSNNIVFKATLSAKNIVKKKAKKIKFSVKLVDKNGKILKKKKITFKIKGKKYKVKTNKKGIATVTIKKLKVGKYTITSSYGGCTIKNTIKIKK